MTYDAENLATPELLWLGIHHKDLKNWTLPSSCFVDLNEKDLHKGQLMLQMPALQAKPTWRKQLVLMAETGKKMELQALASRSISFLCDEFFAEKIASKQWL